MVRNKLCCEKYLYTVHPYGNVLHFYIRVIGVDADYDDYHITIYVLYSMYVDGNDCWSNRRRLKTPKSTEL